MTKREELIQRAEAFVKAQAELNERCEAAIAAIDAAEARRAASHKESMAALDAICAAIDNFSGKIAVTKGDAK